MGSLKISSPGNLILAFLFKAAFTVKLTTTEVFKKFFVDKEFFYLFIIIHDFKSQVTCDALF